MTHHRVELMQRSNDGLNLFYCLALCVSQFLNIFFFGRYEFVERRIQEPNGNRGSLQCFIQSLEVTLLHWFNLCQCSFSFLYCIRADHLTECSDTVSFKEHMFCPAQTNAFCTQLARFLCISRCVSVSANLQNSVLVGPAHNSTKFASDRSIHSRDNTLVDVTGRTIDRDVISLVELLASQSEDLIGFVHYNVRATGYTASTHTTCNNGSMRSHTATNGQDTLGSLHTGDIFR